MLCLLAVGAYGRSDAVRSRSGRGILRGPHPAGRRSRPPTTAPAPDKKTELDGRHTGSIDWFDS